MPAYPSGRSFLLTHFAAFYEEIARIKLAVREGRLVRLLTPETPHAELPPEELAERVSARLLAILDRQQHEVATRATEAEIRAYDRARYVMTALADEVFILELEWPAAEIWTEHLLEYTVAHTRIAGRRFFVRARELIDCRAPTDLEADLAAVMLLALQLGFQGMYRGREGQRTLRAYRSHLHKMARLGELGGGSGRMFAQAYDYAVQVDDSRLRPSLSPWLRAAVYGAIVYVLLSSVTWLLLTHALLEQIGRSR